MYANPSRAWPEVHVSDMVFVLTEDKTLFSPVYSCSRRRYSVLSQEPVVRFLKAPILKKHTYIFNFMYTNPSRALSEVHVSDKFSVLNEGETLFSPVYSCSRRRNSVLSQEPVVRFLKAPIPDQAVSHDRQTLTAPSDSVLCLIAGPDLGDAKRGVPEQIGVQGQRNPLVGCRGNAPAEGGGGRREDP